VWYFLKFLSNAYNKLLIKLYSLLPDIRPYQDPFYVEKDGSLTPNFDIAVLELELDILKSDLTDEEFREFISMYLDKVWDDGKLKLAAIYLGEGHFDRLEKVLMELGYVR
jgi:hypothetical protein